MRSGNPVLENVISSVDLIKITGISRATLNNYIKLGLLPKPIVGKPRDPDMRARQVGYFPSDVLSTLEQIHTLKKTGKTIPEISARLGVVSSPPKPIAPRTVRRTAQPPEELPTTHALQAALFPEMSETSEPSERDSLRFPGSQGVGAPARPSPPQWTSFVILSARIHDLPRLRAELPPEEFIEFFRQFRIDVDDAAQRARMTHVTYSQGGLLCYFIQGEGNRYLLDAIRFSLELRRIARNLNAAWKRRKGWGNRLFVNIGVVDGSDWVARVVAGSKKDICVSGSGVEQALRLCDFARFGSIWTTKTLLSRIGPADREGLRYGIRSQGVSGEVWTEQVYARILDLFSPGDATIEIYQDIASLPITEIIGEGTPPAENSGIRHTRIKDLPSSTIIDSKANDRMQP
jgi:class 3 adenylate cyclase/predicted DNA-binding transcriptional regulator AlpA